MLHFKVENFSKNKNNSIWINPKNKKYKKHSEKNKAE